MLLVKFASGLCSLITKFKLGIEMVTNWFRQGSPYLVLQQMFLTWFGVSYTKRAIYWYVIKLHDYLEGSKQW